MSKTTTAYTQFNGGISDFTRLQSQPNAYAFGRSIDVRSDPENITVLPRTVKESGTVITDLVKWCETYDGTLTSYLYGNTGNLYTRTSTGTYSFLRMVANSHGNGLVYSAEDNFLYYTSDKLVGRYGPLTSTSPQFTDDFFGSQGGVPLNTNSLQLLSASSQYADRADSASLSVTGDLSLSAQINPTTLPAVSSTMAIIAKWNPNGNLRSYMLDIAGVSGYFGDGSSSSLTISADTTEAPIDSACTGTAGSSTLNATNTSFAQGQIIFIHQTQGTNAGQWERNTILSYTAGAIGVTTALKGTYGTGAQVRVMPQYTNVTIDSGKTYTAKAWDGTVGGILAFIANGTVTISGNISADGKGFRGGHGEQLGQGSGQQGEGNTGNAGAYSTTNQGTGGGGGQQDTPQYYGGGAGGGNGTVGLNTNAALPPYPGTTSGTTDLTTILFGGGGGGGAIPGVSGGDQGGEGSAGGGILFLNGATLTISGSVTAAGLRGGDKQAGNGSGGGGGAGGSVLLKAQTATLGTNLITAIGGTAGLKNGGTNNSDGNAGGTGRVHIDYYTSYTGTTTPTLDATQDNSLVTNTSYQLRLSVSSNGTNSEVLAMSFTPTTGQWQQVGVSWKSSTSTATFYLNANALGTRTGAFTTIADTTSRFAVGANYDASSAPINFLNGLIDEVQVYNATQTQDQFQQALASQISPTTSNLQAYYKFNNAATDATGNANTLTLQNSPVYVTNVPFSSPTSRLDIDQQATTTGDTYAVPTAINEGSTDRLTFTPAKDPQKSVAVLVAAKGTGDWTITIHDSLNTVIATATITNANMTTGYVEFFYTALWSPSTNFTNNYHLHITSTVADGTVTTTTNNDLTTVSFRTYFQFLMTDTAWHPMTRFLNFWVVGNGKYLGKYEATLYDPNKISLAAGYRIRCFALWREYLAIGVMKGNNIYDFDNGRIYFWDGVAPTFNFYISVPEGGINAMLVTADKLYIWAGYKNQLLVYGWSFQGGGAATKVKDLPKIENNVYSEIYPQAVTMYQSLIRYGVSGNSNSTNIQRGVYTYGSTNVKMDEFLTYDHVISTGNYGNTVSIGMLAVINQKLLIAWQDGIAYGIDYVSSSNAPYPTAMIEFIIDDANEVWHEKELLEIDAVTEPLLTGESVSLRYASDDDNFVSNLDPMSIGDTVTRLLIPTGRYKETQIGADLTSGATAPTIKGIVAITQALETEERTG